MRCRQKQSGYPLGNPARGGAVRLHLCMHGFSAITIIPGNNIPMGELQKKIVAGLEAPATFRLK
jgi:hypothetical protein